MLFVYDSYQYPFKDFWAIFLPKLPFVILSGFFTAFSTASSVIPYFSILFLAWEIMIISIGEFWRQELNIVLVEHLQMKDYIRAFEAVVYAWGIAETLERMKLISVTGKE